MTVRRLLAGLLWMCAATLYQPPSAGAVPPGTWLIVGTYAPETEAGIYVFRYDPDLGKLESASSVRGIKNPSFVAVHPTGRYVYAVSEVGDPSGQPAGAVVAFRWNSDSETLSRINAQPSGGSGPCHLVVDSTGKTVVVAHYGSGSVSRLPIGNDGQLEADVLTIQHRGSSVHPQRQTSPHAHSVNFTPDQRYVVAADLGTDRLYIHAFDARQGTLTASHSVPIRPGSGPRHVAFHPSGRYLYVINELSNTITVLEYQGESGSFREVQTISTLPTDFKGTSFTAEVVVHPTGKFVYGSNRGHDSIAIFTVKEESGELALVGHEPTQGKTPRNFNLDPQGRFLLAANQQSDNIVVFRVDWNTGKLTPTGEQVHVPRPVCLRWLTSR